MGPLHPMSASTASVIHESAMPGPRARKDRPVNNSTRTLASSSVTSEPTRTADPHQWLPIAAAAQLGAGVLGMAVALKRHHPYDFLMLHGRADKVARDSLLMGTALSAPVVMLVAQGGAVVQVLRGETQPADRVLAGLGTAMVAGYLGEALVRRRLHRSGFDRIESPLVVVGIGLAAAMAVLGLTPQRRSSLRFGRESPTAPPLSK